MQNKKDENNFKGVEVGQNKNGGEVMGNMYLFGFETIWRIIPLSSSPLSTQSSS